MQTKKGQFEYNGNTYTYQAEIPEPLVFTYSRHIYTRLKIINSAGKPAASMPINVSLDSDKGQFNERRYTSVNGEVWFDLSRTMQIATDNRERELVDYTPVKKRASWLAKDVQLRISVGDDFKVVIDTMLEAANGAMSPDESWLQEPVSLKYWRGLPHTFDFINVTAIETSADGKPFHASAWVPGESDLRIFPMMRSLTETMVSSSMAKKSYKIKADGLGYYFGKMANVTAQTNIEIEDFCGDASRYTYLRWLGRHGEIFYWLFKNGTQTTSVKSERYGIALREDVRETNTMLNGIKKEPKREMTRTIASEYVTREQYKVLSSVVSSPYVDMYLGNVDGEDLWKRIDVADGSVSEDMKRMGGKIYSVTLSINIGD